MLLWAAFWRFRAAKGLFRVLLLAGLGRGWTSEARGVAAIAR